jgi:hypothetical protein
MDVIIYIGWMLLSLLDACYYPYWMDAITPIGWMLLSPFDGCYYLYWRYACYYFYFYSIDACYYPRWKHTVIPFEAYTLLSPLKACMLLFPIGGAHNYYLRWMDVIISVGWMLLSPLDGCYYLHWMDVIISIGWMLLSPLDGCYCLHWMDVIISVG